MAVGRRTQALARSSPRRTTNGVPKAHLRAWASTNAGSPTHSKIRNRVELEALATVPGGGRPLSRKTRTLRTPSIPFAATPLKDGTTTPAVSLNRRMDAGTISYASIGGGTLFTSSSPPLRNSQIAGRDQLSRSARTAALRLRYTPTYTLSRATVLVYTHPTRGSPQVSLMGNPTFPAPNLSLSHPTNNFA